MKSIIFTLALAIPIAVNAQREYSRIYDDLYIVDGTKAVVYDYDEVINEQKSVKNVFVRHNRETNYFSRRNNWYIKNE